MNLQLTAVRLVQNTGDLVGQRSRGACHVFECSRQETPPIAIAGEDDLFQVRLNDGERIPARIELGAQADEQKQRPLEQHPVFRNLKRRRQLTEGYIEPAQVGERLQPTA
jgi:hypothetical protein